MCFGMSPAPGFDAGVRPVFCLCFSREKIFAIPASTLAPAATFTNHSSCNDDFYRAQQRGAECQPAAEGFRCRARGHQGRTTELVDWTHAGSDVAAFRPLPGGNERFAQPPHAARFAHTGYKLRDS